jgi:hypothetical protein
MNKDRIRKYEVIVNEDLEFPTQFDTYDEAVERYVECIRDGFYKVSLEVWEYDDEAHLIETIFYYESEEL